MAVYNPLYTVTVNGLDIELSENKKAVAGKRFCIYERQDSGWLEEFHRMAYTDDFAEAVGHFANMVQSQVNDLQNIVKNTSAELQDNGNQQIGGIQ